MEAAHFFLFSQRNKGYVQLLRDKSTKNSPTRKEEPWDDQFGSLAAHYIKTGSYASKGMPVKMKKFVAKQLEQHRLFASGMSSELTPGRVEKLEDIHFPFDTAARSDILEDEATTSARRNRSWEEYRLDLAACHIQKGNYDSGSIEDVELRRWALEQKRQHKLYLAGRPSSLSLNQIQKLVDVKLVSKRPKQKFWVENCADLLAFRIQFGSFDVGRAHVVTSAKGVPHKTKLAGPSINGTALKNVQDWVIKLRELYRIKSDELTKEQKSKLDSVGFPWTGDLPATIEPKVKGTDAEETNSSPCAPIRSHVFGLTVEMQPCRQVK